MLRKFGAQHIAHPVELDGRPILHNVPRIEAVGRHSNKARRRCTKYPLTNALLPGLTGLICVLGGVKRTAFKDDWSTEQVAEGTKGLLIGAVKLNPISLPFLSSRCLGSVQWSGEVLVHVPFLPKPFPA